MPSGKAHLARWKCHSQCTLSLNHCASVGLSSRLARSTSIAVAGTLVFLAAAVGLSDDDCESSVMHAWWKACTRSTNMERARRAFSLTVSGGKSSPFSSLPGGLD